MNRYLIYYNIRANGVMVEGNELIETKYDEPTYEEIKDFYCLARDRHDTPSRPIIINMLKLHK